MRVRFAMVLICGVALSGGGLRAQEFQVVKVPSLAGTPVDQLKPKTIVFTDHREDELFDKNSGFVRFEDWTRVSPVQKQFLGLYPGYKEATVTRSIDGSMKTYQDKLQMYIVDARFVVSKPAASLDLSHYATIGFVQSIDPSIKQEIIKPSEISQLGDERNSNNKNPDRNWCEGTTVALCIRSKYQLEGKLPMGVALANKLRDESKKLQSYIEFESELRILGPTDIDEPGLIKLTGISTPVTAVLEQNIFSVNQIMRFGKFLAIVQPHPSNANTTVVTAMIALAVSATTLEMKRKYEDVPVLRNLVPSQVLMGNSSFNTGNSISAGLPVYSRNRIKAIAENLDK